MPRVEGMIDASIVRVWASRLYLPIGTSFHTPFLPDEESSTRRHGPDPFPSTRISSTDSVAHVPRGLPAPRPLPGVLSHLPTPAIIPRDSPGVSTPARLVEVGQRGDFSLEARPSRVGMGHRGGWRVVARAPTRSHAHLPRGMRSSLSPFVLQERRGGFSAQRVGGRNKGPARDRIKLGYSRRWKVTHRGLGRSG